MCIRDSANIAANASIVAKNNARLEFEELRTVDIVDEMGEAAKVVVDVYKRQGIKLMVVKNTLLHKALESLEEDFSPHYDSLKGTTAIMFCNTANVPAKLIKDKAKDGIPCLLYTSRCV